MAARKQKKEKPATGVLLDRKSLAVHEACASEAGRYATDCVAVLKDGTTMATDGTLLMLVAPTGQDPGDYPDVGKQPVAIPKKGAKFSAKLCKNVMSRLKQSAHKPVLECALVTRCDDKMVEMTTTDLSAIQSSAERPSGEPIPVQITQNIIAPEAEHAAVLTLGTTELRKLLAALSKAGAVGASFVFDARHPEDKATFRKRLVLILAKTGQSGRRLLGVLGRGETSAQELLDDMDDWQKSYIYAAEEAPTSEQE